MIDSPALETAHPRAGGDPAQDVRPEAGLVFDHDGRWHGAMVLPAFGRLRALGPRLRGDEWWSERISRKAYQRYQTGIDNALRAYVEAQRGE